MKLKLHAPESPFAVFAFPEPDLPLWHSSYTLPHKRKFSTYGTSRGTTLAASDFDMAVEYAQRRGFDETISFEVSQRLRPDLALMHVLPSQWLIAEKPVSALHAALWLGMVAAKSGVINPNELLCDNGLIHEISHLISINYNAWSYAEVIIKLQQLEWETPGFWCWTQSYDQLRAEQIKKIGDDSCMLISYFASQDVPRTNPID